MCVVAPVASPVTIYLIFEDRLSVSEPLCRQILSVVYWDQNLGTGYPRTQLSRKMEGVLEMARAAVVEEAHS